MSTLGRSGRDGQTNQARESEFRLAPMARAIALALVAGAVAAPGYAQAQARPFGSGWMAAKGAVQGHIANTGTLPNGMLAGVNSAARQQQQSRQQLDRSVANLGRTAAAIAAQQVIQAAARANAPVEQPVPDGYTSGGLWDKDEQGNPLAWTGANRPEAGNNNGKHQVNIKQTADKAILNWDTFHVGKNTTLNFDQSGGSPNSDASKSSDWAVLNKVVGAGTAPSQIQGAITAQGAVMIVNQNGIVFAGGSQVNARNLVAAATRVDETRMVNGQSVNALDEQFLTNGIYSAKIAGADAPSFAGAGGKVRVEAGARIETGTPSSVTQGGGYVLLLGSEVHNAGTITTPQGQTVLAAGDSFFIRKGRGTDGNPDSTTRGNEVTALSEHAQTSGLAVNSGLIAAPAGDITLTGNTVQQNGVLISTTSVNDQGTIHLHTANRAGDALGTTGAITFAPSSTTAIVLDVGPETALDAQHDAALGGVGAANPYRTDQSLIEIVSDGTIAFQRDSMTLATGGQIAVSAGRRTLLADGATLDVAGAIGVKVSMESNSLDINVQGNEQRDSPINRDSKNLNNSTIWVDRRSLVFVKGDYDAQANPDGTPDRWYTAGGLLEVGGYLATGGHSVGEWMAQGGTVTLGGGEVVTQSGSAINLSGGTLDVQDGYINQSWLRGSDGRLYEVSRAPGDLLYKGLYKGYEDTHERWGDTATRTFYNPLIAPRRRFEPGYTVGRDAGRLLVSSGTAVLEGEIVGDVFQGNRQTQAPQFGLDGYKQTQSAAARRSQWIIGQYSPVFDTDAGTVVYNLGARIGEVDIGNIGEQIADALGLDDVLPADREGRLYLDADQLNSFDLGALTVAASGRITVDGAVKMADGGEIVLHGPHVDINADLTVRGGGIKLGNMVSTYSQSSGWQDIALPAPDGSSVTLASGAVLDARGVWSNLLRDPQNGSSLPYINGGNVSIRGTGGVTLKQGSVIDVSSGAAILADGGQRGGRGGDVALAANSLVSVDAEAPAALTLKGELRGYGANGGGTLELATDSVLIDAPDSVLIDAAGTAMIDASGTALIDNGAPAAQPGQLVLAGNFFDKGFARYDVAGYRGLAVAEGARVDVTMPVYRFTAAGYQALTGADPAAGLDVWTPDLYQENPVKGKLTQRAGASLALSAGPAALDNTVVLEIGRDAQVSVDPGQSITLNSAGQLTVDGRLNAWGGRIALLRLAPSNGDANEGYASPLNRSIWIGDHAMLDVAARAVTALDMRGRRYGDVSDGGSIVIGGQIDPDTGKATAVDAFVVLRPGAVLDASGAQASFDTSDRDTVVVGSNGGGIAFSSYNGLFLDGTMRAAAGGAGAAGGSLSVALEAPLYKLGVPVDDQVLLPRELTLGQHARKESLAVDLQPGQADDKFIYGSGYLDVDSIQAGGFDNLFLRAANMLSVDGDVSLNLGQSLRISTSALALSEEAAEDARVHLAAPYVRLGAAGGSFEGVVSGVSQQPTQARFDVSANLIDIADNLTFGIAAALPRSSGDVLTVDRRGFDRVTLASQGDIRFLQGTGTGNGPGITRLTTAGDMNLVAAQLYPATGAVAQVMAGYIGGALGYAPGRVLSIGRSDDTEPATPYSAFGFLTLGAEVIDQGGVLRAPLGLFEFGTNVQDGTTRTVNFLPGSITSVSAAGLAMPYGGTVDGIAYDYDGKPITLLGAGGTDISGNLDIGINTVASSVYVEPGAIFDLSGGGELTGAGFIAGRGGSVDARYAPLTQFDRAGGRFTLPGLATNPVYAIVPGSQTAYAPVAPEGGAVDPAMGQQIKIAAGVPGLPAGTYTLLPSTYALLPGAFRVEINGLTASQQVAGPAAVMRNGSWSATASLGIVHTQIGESLGRQVILTPADVLRSYSQYNETSYADFARADAARLGVPRAMLPADAKTWQLRPLASLPDEFSLEFKGTGRFDPAQGGFGGSVVVAAFMTEVLADGAARTPGYTSVRATDLNGIGASRIAIGGLPYIAYGQGGNFMRLPSFSAGQNVTLRTGAVLAAPEVFLITGSDVGGIVVEQGAGINTLGQGPAAYDSTDGFIYAPGRNGLLAVSNGWLNMLAPDASLFGRGSGTIDIGTCALAPCGGVTELYSEGTIAAATDKAFTLDEAVRYGTRNLTLAVGGINVGDTQALADAGGRGALPPGLTLSQGLLNRLLAGDAGKGAPALESLVLTARDAVNFYGTTELSTIDPATGASTLERLVLTTPAMYGYGGAGDVAAIRTGSLVWNGAATPAGAVAANGAGTGAGTLDIQAERIEFGYGPNTQPSSVDSLDRLALGFETVNLDASERITANHKGGLAVYRSQGAYVEGSGYTYSGGNLNITTPLMTGEAGSVNRIKAGGAIMVKAPAGADPAASADALGAELALEADSITVDTAIVLPSGKLTLSAQHELLLGDSAHIDMSGRKVDFNDVSKYSWGGDVILESQAGNITQAAGSSIDLSAQNNRAGIVNVVALGETAGMVDLRGGINAGASGYYDAGGTYVPYGFGEIDIRGQRIADFAGLNQRLNQGQVFGARSFQLKQGNLTIGDEIKAREVNVSVDGGSLAVVGTIDASGEQVGGIRLAARDGLTLTGTAVLDAHGTVLRVDSYGKIIDAPNRAIVELNAGSAGRLTLAGGARIDVRAGTSTAAGTGAGQNDGVNRGTVELNARRLGSGPRGNDIDIDARGPVNIQGARSIAVNGVWQYNDAPDSTDLSASGRPYQVIDKDYLIAKNGDSQAFMTNALANDDLMQHRLAGLRGYADAFHLRPGVEIISKTPGGDLVVRGDIDLSGYRYASVNPHSQLTSIYGSGEPGALAIRAGGNLDIYGSINDGFAPPSANNDEANGWILQSGKQPFGGDLIVPLAGVKLADGTQFPAGKSLNFALPIKGMTMTGGTRLPVAATLDAPLTLGAGAVLAADIRDEAGGVIYPAGTVLRGPVTLPAGTQLGAGTVLTGDTPLRALVWPKGVPLPHLASAGFDMDLVVQDGLLSIPVGGLIPARTVVVLEAGAKSIDLRPTVDGIQGKNWAIASMLSTGSSSWSMRLVAGADTAAADTRTVKPRTAGGSLTLADSHYGIISEEGLVWSPENDFAMEPGTVVTPDLVIFCDLLPYECVVGVATTLYNQNFSVVRTGTGDLDVLAAGDVAMASPYGVYTAGTQSASLAADGAADPYEQARGSIAGGVLGGSGAVYEPLVNGSGQSLYHAWYPELGGNMLVAAGGDITGDSLGSKTTGNGDRAQPPSAAVGNWLWRQGSGSGSGADDIPTAWWINFGTYALEPFANESTLVTVPYLSGFTGIGALGGGNVTVAAGGDAGTIAPRGDLAGADTPRSQGLIVAVGSTGRMAPDGELVLTGGGDLDVRIGGGMNTSLQARPINNSDVIQQTLDLNGALVNLRGSIRLSAGAVGIIEPVYGSTSLSQDPKESRAFDAFTATASKVSNGLVVIPGDATVDISTRGDLVLGGTADPGRVTVPNSTPFTVPGVVAPPGGGLSWFSLWSDRSAINLFSAGGNLTPSTQLGEVNANGGGAPWYGGRNTLPTDGRFVYPSILHAVAASGSLYYGPSALSGALAVLGYSLTLAPSFSGHSQLEFLAADSIYAGGYAVNQSGASPDSMPTPWNPAFVGATGLNMSDAPASNLGIDGIAPILGRYPLFAFGPDTASGMVAADAEPARFYAVDGDIVGLRTGERLSVGSGMRAGRTWFEAAGPVWMMAGRDIVNSGTALGAPVVGADEIGNGSNTSVSSTGNLIVHNKADDVSVVSAGRDILYSSFSIAGPGLLEISAGRHLLQEDRASIDSIGPVANVNATNRSGGAGIAVIVGAGAQGPGYADFAARYLDPSNQATPGLPLADQPGKVAKTYEAELLAWLQERFGYQGSAQEALAYFLALPAEQQRILDRQIYFAELYAGGREYNNANGPRFGSYLRGRNAIAALFPTQDAAGKPIAYDGDITIFGDAGIQTKFGGDIQLLTPGGQQVFGTEGEPPAGINGTPGVITQGSGNIQMYSLGSILLGQSRIMTTFGGNIQAWSAQGDINAGRGSKTTVVYTPPRRVYDQWGNVTLSPDVPSTGAGIATLAPIAEVPGGSVDLIAPEGTVDIGEAGVRSSDEVNIAALHVANAANIQAAGEVVGVPVLAAVNVGALTSASAASASAATAAQDTVQRGRAAARQAMPSIFSVQVLGFGSEPVGGKREVSAYAPSGLQPKSVAMRYDPANLVQLVGNGQSFDSKGLNRLTDAERRYLQQDR